MFHRHTENTAPATTAGALRKARASIGFVPGVYAVLAGAPAAYSAYEQLYGLFQRETAFTALERQIVMMTANRFNDCAYCIAGHSMMMSAAKMPAEHIAALRDGMPLADPKLEALRSFTADLLLARGHLPEERVASFLVAGYSSAQALEILIGLAAKLIANFASSLADLPVDEPAKQYEWLSSSLD